VTGRRWRPAAFLDRDGTIIIERGFLADPAGVELLPGAAAALRDLSDAGFALVVITNQSGIARGLFTEKQYLAVQSRTEELLRDEHVALDGAWFCPHHPEFTGPCECRKPGLALFREAAETLGLDAGRSVWIGDRLQDVLPAVAFGGRAFLVRTGYGREQERRAAAGIIVCDDLAGAVRHIVAESQG
jgi:D,D-heptose 1,7-bisphosphate phosphatase